MDSIEGRYERVDGGNQSFFLIKLNMHNRETKKALRAWEIRNLLAAALEQSKKLSEEIDFTIEITRYYNHLGE